MLPESCNHRKLCDNQGMILPKISIRTLLISVACVALLLGILVTAMEGNRLAIAAGAGVISLLFTFMLFALLHWITLLFAMIGSRPESRGESPFAQTRQPPQLLRPDDPV